MTQPAQALGTAAPFSAGRPLPPILALIWRYSLSTAGPVAVSGAHFLASLVFVRNLSSSEFGIFSFVLVVSAFAMSITGAGLVLPVTQSMVKGERGITAACFKLSLVVGSVFAAALIVAVTASGTSISNAAPLGAFGAMMAYRWFARSLVFIEGRVLAAILSDLLYSAVMVAGLGVMVITHSVSLRAGGILMLLSAIASLITFGKPHWRQQFQALRDGRLCDYFPVFHNVTGWSLLGVALTEVTVNAHAYLVTFIAGPSAFALPALGMLLMRPASLVQSALPDLERPAFMRAIAAKDGAKLTRTLNEFQGALTLVLLVTMLLAAALLYFVPQWLLKHGYARQDVALAALFCALIMAARSVRTPLSVLLQAAGEFKALARLGGLSAAVSIAGTLTLLLTFGAVASLGGILAGDIVILICIWPLARKVRHAND